MARIKQTSRRRLWVLVKSYQDLVEEARDGPYDPSIGFAYSNGWDNVRRYIRRQGGLCFEGIPNETPLRYTAVRRSDGQGSVYVAVYPGYGPAGTTRRIASPTAPATRSKVGPSKLKKRKFSHTVRAVRQIRKYQGRTLPVHPHDKLRGDLRDEIQIHTKHATRLLIPTLSFQRLVREIAHEIKSDLRMTSKALEALQVSAEDYLVRLFQDANILCCEHSQRGTLLRRDIVCAVKIRRDAPSNLDDRKSKPRYREDGVNPKFPGAPPG